MTLQAIFRARNIKCIVLRHKWGGVNLESIWAPFMSELLEQIDLFQNGRGVRGGGYFIWKMNLPVG